MEIPVLAKTMELDNLYHIYLFYVDDRWCAFGCSAYYLSIMYPELDDFAEAFFTSDGDCLPLPSRYRTLFVKPLRLLQYPGLGYPYTG